MEKEYTNPYHPADLPNPSLETVPTQSQYVDPVDSILHSRVGKQASIETQTATKYFDANATNFERFAHSPCYTTLGFDPNANLEVQENRYQECESGKRNDNLKNISIATLVILSFAALIYFGVAKKSE